MPSLKEVASLGAYIRDQRVAAQVSLRQLAHNAGVSNPYLSQIERGLKKPSAEILSQIAKGLRISAESLYVHAGILDERPEGSRDVVGAVLADASIDERHKRVLIEVYDSFRAEHAATTAAPASARSARRPTKTATGGGGGGGKTAPRRTTTRKPTKRATATRTTKSSTPRRSTR